MSLIDIFIIKAKIIPGYGIRPYVTSSVKRIPNDQTSLFMENLIKNRSKNKLTSSGW